MERDDEKLLDIADLAEHLRIEQRSVRRMVADGRLPPAVAYGGLPRWRWGVIRDWMRAWEVIDRLNLMDGSGRARTETGQERTPKK